MNIKSIKIGQEIKNYKELCNTLEIEIKSGASKRSQLKDLARYFKYHKDKNKFIIDEIYDKPLPEEPNKNNKYIREIETILTYYLFEHKEDLKVILSISQLINILGLANNTYSLGTYKKKELSEILNIQKAAIYFFYSTTRTEFKNIIKRALKNLESRSVILNNTVFVIREKNNKNIIRRKANDEETSLILDAEKLAFEDEELNKNGVKCKRDLFLAGSKAYKRYIEVVNKELPKQWEGYYKAYEIHIGKYAITSELTKVLLDKSNLNDKLVERIRHLLKVDHNFNKNTIENLLINKLISFKGYDDELNSALKELYIQNKREYYEKLKEFDWKSNEIAYNRHKAKEEYKNKDEINDDEFKLFMNESKFLKSHILPNTYYEDLLKRIDQWI
ncbi:hypothetical protein D9O40_16760 [Clostridium autoethanogenum]|uniref:Uncharacterized protein n=1 Tax=Clostridium autoethanogenum TaxID=84023 RepID=A0A3M0SBT9_9CLOT|nr:hypothetical protein [Clostridium autoethanogenum]RMC95190.1 hypothetical protein D9O40_16760 [Clostridium autoethanogenum]